MQTAPIILAGDRKTPAARVTMRDELARAIIDLKRGIELYPAYRETESGIEIVEFTLMFPVAVPKVEGS